MWSVAEPRDRGSMNGVLMREAVTALGAGNLGQRGAWSSNVPGKVYSANRTILRLSFLKNIHFLFTFDYLGTQKNVDVMLDSHIAVGCGTESLRR